MDFAFGLFVLALSSSLILTWGVDDAYNFNVINHGAKSDGRTDNSKAFLRAWDAACKVSAKTPTIYVPRNTTFLVNPVIFRGPCKAPNIKFMILGNVIAPKTPKSWDGKDASAWLAFDKINGLQIDGSGTIDGQGKAWWDQSCRYHPNLKNCTSTAPTALKILGCNKSSVMNIKIINSAQTHILVSGCNNVIIDNVTIASPGDSPNTDGIHIASSHQLHITNSAISCGDDCVSIGNRNSDMNITNIHCLSGHGISIGSLGGGGSVALVENIKVTDCTFNGTTNGARIKTWQGGRGYVKHIVFERLTFNNVKNPIIIDQNYCDVRGRCPEQKTGVQISNVTYHRAVGTSATQIAINLNCSKSVPCTEMSMKSIQLTSAIDGSKVTANCSNARGQEDGVVPGPCLVHV